MKRPEYPLTKPVLTERGADAQFPVQGRMRVLVVDDNAINQLMAGALLNALGYEVVAVFNGIDALAACQIAPPDLVLMDIEMPLMDGLEVTERLRVCQRLGTLPPFPIVAATGGSDRFPKSHCLDAGMDGYLTKPLDMQMLAVELHRLLPNR